MSAARITIQKWGGDDSLSWAVLIDGRVKYNGLSRTEARHYQSMFRKERGFK